MRWICSFIVAFIPWTLWALSQQPLLSKKDGKTNNFAVNVTVMALDNGIPVEKRWLDNVLFNSVSHIHDNGVVELRYPSGLRSYSVAGKEPKTRFLQAGAIFPKRGWIKEEVNGTPIYHIQTAPILDRIKVKIHKLTPIDYELVEPISGYENLSQLDQYLLDLILSGDPDDREYLLKEYPHKFAIESATGRTAYLKLDNFLPGSITHLRIKGCMPQRGWFRRLKTHLTSDRIIKMVGDIPTIVKSINTMTPLGTMTYASAKNEFIAAQHFGGDEPLALGKYRLRHRNQSTSFVIYGMTEEDHRIKCEGRNNVWLNNITHEMEPMGHEGPAFFRSVGQHLRGSHAMGLIHRAFHLGNIGYTMSGQTKIPVFKDLEDAFRLDIKTSIYERAGWMFNDVAWPIHQWAMAMEPGIESEDYARQFLEGYFDGYVSKDVVNECISPLFARKMDAMAEGPLDIPDQFPHLYRAILSKEVMENAIHNPMDVIEGQINIVRWIENNS